MYTSCFCTLTTGKKSALLSKISTRLPYYKHENIKGSWASGMFQPLLMGIEYVGMAGNKLVNFRALKKKKKNSMMCKISTLNTHIKQRKKSNQCTETTIILFTNMEERNQINY